jgi:putative tricarboxylic transport membrane protein
MKKLLVGIGMMIMSTGAFAKEPVELLTRFSVGSVIGQNILQLNNAFNKVQNKYDFKMSTVPGAGGESAYALGFEKANSSGSKIVFVSSVSDFSFGKIEFPNRTWNENDLIFVSGLFRSPAGILVAKDSPINTVEELVASIRNKKSAFIASSANGRSNIYLGDRFVSHYKLDNLKPLKYGPVADIIAGVVRGEADFTVFSVVDTPMLKPLAMATDKRLETMPNIQTTKELGIKDMQINPMSFVSVPAQFLELAKDVEDLMKKVCQDKEFIDSVRAKMYDVSNMCMTGKEIRSIAASEYKRIVGVMQ